MELQFVMRCTQGAVWITGMGYIPAKVGQSVTVIGRR